MSCHNVLSPHANGIYSVYIQSLADHGRTSKYVVKQYVSLFFIVQPNQTWTLPYIYNAIKRDGAFYLKFKNIKLYIQRAVEELDPQLFVEDNVKITKWNIENGKGRNLYMK